MTKIFLVEVEAYNKITEQEETLYFASGGLTAPFPSGDADRPNQYYKNRVEQPANFNYTAFNKSTTSGGSKTGAGLIKLINEDGGLDYLIDYAFDGREIKVLQGTVTQTYNQYTTILTGTLEQAQFHYTGTNSELQLIILNKQAELDIPIQENKYLGDNVLPDGVEGTEDDIQDTEKPLTYGKVFNITPVNVNTSKLIYQVHDGSIEAFNNIYDNGVALTLGTDHATAAALEASGATGGIYNTCLAYGLFKLGSSPVGLVTCDAEGANAVSYISTVADIIQNIVTTKTNIIVDTGTVSEVNTNLPHEVGFYLNNSITISKVLDDLCQSIGCAYVFDKQGVLKIYALGEPEITADHILSGGQILGINKLRTGDSDKGIPAFKVNVEYQRNYTTQDRSQLAGSVTDDRASYLEQEYRTTSTEDASIKTAHLLAPELDRTTLLTTKDDADSMAAHWLSLYKIRRDRYRITIRENYGIDLMQTITLQYDRFGLGAGKNFLVLGITYQAATNEMIVELWG